jgi:hypothetical protein
VATVLAAVGVAAAGAGDDGSAAGGECRLDGVPVPGFAQTRLAPARFAELHRAVTPRPGAERWAEIPWQTDLAAARRQAARENKPLFLWIMDGHPLGCT